VAKESSDWHPLAAFVLPFMVFAVVTSIESLEMLKEWYPLLNGIKTVAILGVLWWGRKYYPAWSSKGIGTGLVFGLVGGIAWIVLSTWSFEKDVLPGLMAKLGEWLNMPSLAEWIKPGSRVGYNPFAQLTPLLAWTFTVVRLIELVIAVPIMEELFWRGFLNRYLIDERWQQVAWGRFTRLSFAIVTLAFVAVHTEWTAAVVWGIGINLVFWKTRNLWACIVAHAASNAVLGYYILVYKQWHLW
jgi:membrane protease YdiL (CAAX protease family)